ncbi:MAG TPA: peptide ligase PGM1-related protein [Xenococcaceae cyanobacterium]|jgi:hypothetical protein
MQEVVPRFRELQGQLRDRWQNVTLSDQDNCDILVIPSFSIDPQLGKKIPGFLHYEERLLFSLIRLRNPHTRVIYVTALPLCPIIIDYYLQLLPGIPFSHARERLLQISLYDASFKPLTQKILERPRLVAKIRRALRRDRSYMVCYNSTNWERELSVKLDIPLLAASPEVLYWGSKSGSREIFAECQIPHPDGSNNVTSTEELLKEIANLWTRQPQLRKMVIKLNEGFSGEGNAILNLTPIKNYAPHLCDRHETLTALNKQLENLSFQAEAETWANFSLRIPELGAIVEAFIEGEVKLSPSVQGYIRPSGEVSILSTHDQILGGADNQIYLGCCFPADAGYRLQLQELGLKVGQALAAKGAIESYGVDFLAIQNSKSKEWELQAIEINLRKGGTTHPFMTLKLLTNGNYDYATGLFFTQQHQPKHYIASDNLQKNAYRGLLPYDLMDIVAQARLHFDSSTRTGNVFHLMGALSEFGKLGVTSIGDSREEAQAIYEQVEQVLDFETQMSHNRASSLPINWI